MPIAGRIDHSCTVRMPWQFCSNLKPIVSSIYTSHVLLAAKLVQKCWARKYNIWSKGWCVWDFQLWRGLGPEGTSLFSMPYLGSISWRESERWDSFGWPWLLWWWFKQWFCLLLLLWGFVGMVVLDTSLVADVRKSKRNNITSSANANANTKSFDREGALLSWPARIERLIIYLMGHEYGHL